MHKYGVFSGPYFPTFGLHTDQKKLRTWTPFSVHHRYGGRSDFFFLTDTYETLDHLQYVSDDDVDKFQIVIGQLHVDY